MHEVRKLWTAGYTPAEISRALNVEEPDVEECIRHLAALARPRVWRTSP